MGEMIRGRNGTVAAEAEALRGSPDTSVNFGGDAIGW